jgi:hypothetical protein
VDSAAGVTTSPNWMFVCLFVWIAVMEDADFNESSFFRSHRKSLAYLPFGWYLKMHWQAPNFDISLFIF